MKYLIFPILFAMMCSVSCGNTKKEAKSEDKVETKVNVPAFNADSAYSYVEKQVAFGPRVPNSKGHKECGDYLVAKLKSFGAQVTTQEFEVNRYDGQLMKARNIIASFDSDNTKRVMLCAHWDTRPWADNDPDKANYHTAIDGANDGASGVGVLLEIARLISQDKPEVGIDIILFDVEDSGTPRFYEGQYDDRTWCLGSQYWALNPHKSSYNARYAILLDMVGAADAAFYREGFSDDYASTVVDKIWKKAAELGYGNIFVNSSAGYITDDHIPVNEIARIPCVDIIHNNPTAEGFGDFWHTVNDNMQGIDRGMLHNVGTVIMNVIYSEK